MAVWPHFEAYNLHRENRFYAGVPAQPFVRGFAFLWSFAAIMPGVFETADLVRALLPPRTPRAAPAAPRGGAPAVSFILGIAMVTIPVAVPGTIAAHTFGFVWLGFILPLEPVLELAGIGGVASDWRQGEWQTAASQLVAGSLCGLLWEAWN